MTDFDAESRREWDILEHAFLGRPFFPTRAVLREKHGQVLVQQSWIPRLAAVVVVAALGVLMIYSAIYLDESRRFPPLDWVPIGVIKLLAPAVGLFMICAAGFGLLLWRRLVLDQGRGCARFCFGVWPKIKCVSLPLQSCVLRLKCADLSDEGQTHLSVESLDGTRRIQLFWAKWRPRAVELLDRLEPHFQSRAVDESLDRGEDQSFGIEGVVRAPMKTAAEARRSHKVFFYSDRLVVRRTGLSYVATIVMGLIGFVFLVLVTAGLVMGADVNWQTETLVFFGGILSIGGWLVARQRLVIHRQAGVRLGRLSVVEGEFPTRAVALDEIVGVQICSFLHKGERLPILMVPFQLPDLRILQLNLACRQPPRGRIHLLTDTDEARLVETANRLADFLEKPLLDHRSMTIVISEETDEPHDN